MQLSGVVTGRKGRECLRWEVVAAHCRLLGQAKSVHPDELFGSLRGELDVRARIVDDAEKGSLGCLYKNNCCDRHLCVVASGMAHLHPLEMR